MSVNFEGGKGLENKKVCQFSEEEIEEIRRNDPNAEILKIVYDEVDRVLTMKEVRSALSSIRTLYEMYRKEDSNYTDDEIRTKICDKSTIAKSMCNKTHPKLFQAMTSRKSTQDDFQMIMFNIHLRERVESGSLSEEESVAALYAELMRREQAKK